MFFFFTLEMMSESLITPFVQRICDHNALLHYGAQFIRWNLQFFFRK